MEQYVMLINIEELEDLFDMKLVCKQTHPELPITIWNYTKEAQYAQMWDQYPLLLKCRGLVTDNYGSVVAAGFPKFFNIEELRHEATPNFEIFEKLDGQLITVFWYNGKMVVASRGSFTSPYAQEADRLLKEKYGLFEKNLKLLGLFDLTFCFELIGFEQIVVRYPESDLVAIGCFKAGLDHNFPHPIDGRLLGSVPIVKKHQGLDYKNIKQLNWDNAEGFVVRFSNGDRCKIKFENYVMLHYHMTDISTLSVWRILSDGKSIESTIPDEVPDEFYEPIRKYEKYLIDLYREIEDANGRLFDTLFMKTVSRKELADEINKLPKTTKYLNTGVMFSMLDGIDYSSYIWKKIRPKFEILKR